MGLYGIKYLSFDGKKVTSPHYSLNWPKSGKVKATCSVKKFPNSSDPFEFFDQFTTYNHHDISNCTCGIYAYDGFYFPGAYKYEVRGRFSTIPFLVEGFGTVVVGENGWKATEAKIINPVYVAKYNCNGILDYTKVSKYFNLDCIAEDHAKYICEQSWIDNGYRKSRGRWNE